MKIEKRETEIWEGTYRGVDFEIKHFRRPPNEFNHEETHHWTYYLIIDLSKIPKESKPNQLWLKAKPDDKGRVFYRYNNCFLISHLDFHGGCTYYSKLGGFDGSSRVVKIGCDYQHLWDEGYIYDLEWVTGDVIKTIEQFLTYIPDYKY